MIDGQTYYVLEDEGGTVHAITGGWEAPTFPDGVGAWALRQCSERNESREGDSRGGIVFRFTPEELRVWLQGAGPSLSQAFPGETWATFGNSRTCGEVDYVYPGEWVWKPRGVDPATVAPAEWRFGPFEVVAGMAGWGVRDVRTGEFVEDGHTRGGAQAAALALADGETVRIIGCGVDPFDGPDESFGVDPDLARDLERGK